MKIYVIQGSTGEYSDHREWLVKAFKDEDEAKSFVQKADAIVREFEINKPNGPGKWSYFSNLVHPMDPDFEYDCYSGTHYTYFEVELV